MYEGSSFSRPRQHLLLYVFFIIANLVGVKWYLCVALICIYLNINNVEDGHGVFLLRFARTYH